MKYNPSGLNHINKKGRTRFGGNLISTGKEEESLEGKTPPDGDFEIGGYDNIVYKINRDGIVKGQNGKELKPLIRNGISYVTLVSKNGKTKKRETIPVFKLMDKIFGEFFPGYSEKDKKPSKYKLVPKDGDYTNLKYNNLEYVDIYTYTKIGIVRTLIEWGIKDEVIIKGCKITNKKLREIKKNMQKEGYEDFIEKIGIKFSLEDYIKIAYEGKHLSDKELSEETELKEKDIKIIRRRLKYEYFIKKTGIKISFGVYIMIAYEGKDSKDKELSKKTRIKLKDIKIIRHRLKKLEDENL